MNAQLVITDEVKRLPKPIKGVIVNVPLRLLPAYQKLHNIKPNGYDPDENILFIEHDAQVTRGAEGGELCE